MNYSNYRFTLDIQSNLSQVSLPVKLNDSGRRLLIGLTDGGNPYQISKGSLAKFTFKKSEPNSEGVYESGLYDCVLEDNYSTIRFDLTRAVTGVAGVVDCEIRLYGPNGRLITSPRFIIVVDDRVIYDDDIPLTDEQASTIDAIILSEAKRVEAENKRVKAEAAREETLREAIVSIDQSIQEITPSIGDNGNWFIGEEDTGTPATGNDVVTVTVTGNETDGYTADKTFAEIVAAEKEGKIVQVYHYGCVLQLSYKPTASTRVYSSFITNGGFITITLRTRGTGPIDGVFVRRVEFDTNGKPAWTLRSAGTVVVPADEWDDESPSSAYIGIEGMEAGDLILLTPADTPTTIWCEDLHVHVSTVIIDSVNDRTLLFRCGLGDTYAGGDLTFDYRVLTCSEPLTQCVAVLAGVEYGYCDMIARVQKSLTQLEEEKKDAAEDLGELKGVLWGTDDVGKSVRKVASEVTAEHNTSMETHADIRLLIKELGERLAAIADSDDETLDQLSEMVAYIKANRGLIESVTTSKVSVSDVINNLVTNVTGKPLSAAQGVALKGLIDDLARSKMDSASVTAAIAAALSGYAKTSDLPMKLSQLEADESHRTVTDAEKAAWNAKAPGDHTHEGVYATVDQLAGKLSVYQDPANVGKILVVGTDGNLTLTDMPEGGASGDVVGTLDGANNILLTGALASGTYTLKYEYEDGTVSDVGIIEVGAIPEPEPEPTNLFVIGGDGYIESGRCSSTGADRTDASTCFVTNYIKVSKGDTVYIKGYATPTASGAFSGIKYTGETTGGFMLETETSIVKDFSLSNGIAQVTINADNADYVRFTINKTYPLDSIVITVNQEIV